MRLLIVAAFLSITAAAQNPAQIQPTPTTPSGACNSTAIRLLTPNGTIYTCQSGTWAASSGGGGSPGGIVTPTYTKTSSSVATFGSNLSASVPWNLVPGVVSITGTCVVTNTSGTNSDTLYVYGAPVAGQEVVGYSSANTYTISGTNCALAASISSFPAGSLPLGTVAVSAGVMPASWTPWAGVNPISLAAGPGIVSSVNATTQVDTISTDSTVVPRYFTGSGQPSANCTAGRDFYTDTTGLNLYFCDATNMWKQGNGGSQTIIANWPMCGYNATLGGTPAPLFNWTNSTSGCGHGSFTGPSSISYLLYGLDLAQTTDSVMVQMESSSTWSAAAGTIDVSLAIYNFGQGAPSAGNCNINVYIGCQTAGSNFTYGTASTITATPPANNLEKIYTATSLNLPASCAASVPMQVWVHPVADTGGSTGVIVQLASIQTTIRGN